MGRLLIVTFAIYLAAWWVSAMSRTKPLNPSAHSISGCRQGTGVCEEPAGRQGGEIHRGGAGNHRGGGTMRRRNGDDIGWLLVCTCMFLSLVSVQMLYERRGWLEETVGTARRPASDLRFFAGVWLAGDTETVALPARPERAPGSLTTTASTTRKIAVQAKPSDDRYDGQTKDRSWLTQ